MGVTMLRLFKQFNQVQSPPLSLHASFILDTVRALGPAQEPLRSRFGSEMRNFLAGFAQPLDAVARVGLATDTGTRPRDEDSAIALMAHLDDYRWPVPLILLAVADGIGGSADGDLASALAIQTLAEVVVDHLVDVAEETVHVDLPSIEEMLLDAFGTAHRRIKQQTNGGGSTLTAALVVDRTAYIAHVGDSRAYWLDGATGEIDLLTRDHRFVRDWVDLGVISPQEAADHPQSHVLYRALGKLDQCEVDLTHRILDDGSQLLLCTDGIWETVDPVNLTRVLRRSNHPQAACDELVRQALANEARDDVTAVLLKLPA
jgi:serine/threonine protein phosphatase PrpC